MTGYVFYIVDVFAEEKYASNPLAVVKDAGVLSDKEMQQIAREMNYSETTFILSDEKQNCGFDVRIFTPKEEVPFAGHPTLGTAYIIQREILKKTVKEVILNLKVGQVPVTFNYTGGQADILWMKQTPPEFGKVLDSCDISRVLNIDEQEIDRSFPIQEVSTGFPFIIVPLRTLDAIKKCRIDRDRYFRLIENTDAKAILVFCPETYNLENDLNVRAFVDYYGIPEDPATGSANGCLAAYLVKHRYSDGDKIDLRVEQGYEIGRPSLLYLKSGSNDGNIEVQIGGKVEMVAKGHLL